MGRYLAIGITIDLSFEKKKAAREFASLEAGVKYVDEHYAPLDLYDKAEDDEYVTYKLKDQFLENGLVVITIMSPLFLSPIPMLLTVTYILLQ